MYHLAYICENGHPVDVISDYCVDRYCTQCGAPIIFQCPICGETINGMEHDCSGSYVVPSYCRGCGNPLPWTDRAAQATAELLAEDENITTDEANKLVDVFPDIITETPRTQLAVVRLKKAMKNLGSFAAEALKQFVLDFGCELVKRQLGL